MSNHVNSDDEDEIGNWPRRLLHVPTLTSYKWESGNFYGGRSCPEYAAISYTWGRWMIRHLDDDPSVESLAIKGTSWPIPRVQPILFTVSQFEAAIRSCTKRRNQPDLEFLWLDIACIDQNENSVEGLLEIGRQAKIFDHAAQTFVWLASNGVYEPPDQSNPGNPGKDINCLVSTTGPMKDLISFVKEASDLPKPTSSEDQQRILSKMSEYAHIFKGTEEAISCLTKYPWYQSLWTLQEAFLSVDATFLDRNGCSVPDDNGHLPSMRDMVNAIHTIYEACIASQNLRSEIGGPTHYPEKSCLDWIEWRGLHSLFYHNPMVLLPEAKGRMTSRKEDIVYGIMQVFKFRLGKSSLSWDRKQEFSLLDLEVQLGISLAEQFPILSQLHIHPHMIDGRQGWRGTRASVSPGWDSEWAFRNPRGDKDSMTATLGAKEVSLIDPNTTSTVKEVIHGVFRGRTCDFRLLSSIWGNMGRDIEEMHCNTDSSFQVALDRSPIFTETQLGISCTPWQVPQGKPQKDLVEAMVRILDEKKLVAKVLMLGGRETSHVTFYGVIIVECFDKVVGKWFARVGICNWNVPYPTTEKVAQEDSSLEQEAEYWRRYKIMTGESDDWKYKEVLFG